jgi:hypothetical protein
MGWDCYLARTIVSSTAKLKVFLHGKHLANNICPHTSSGGKHRRILGSPFIVNLFTTGWLRCVCCKGLGIRTHWSSQNTHITNFCNGCLILGTFNSCEVAGAWNSVLWERSCHIHAPTSHILFLECKNIFEKN